MHVRYIFHNLPKFLCLSPRTFFIALGEQVAYWITSLKDFYQFILPSALYGYLPHCSLPSVISANIIFITIGNTY